MRKFLQILTKTLLASLLLLSVRSIGQSVDFTQARNHFQNVYAIDWVPGILNSTHTDYFEGQGICQRLIFTGLTGTSHTATLKVLADKGNIHAYDFLVSWEQAWKTARDIGNGSLNELATLASDVPPVTIDETVAWKDAVSNSIKNDILPNVNNPTPAQLAAAFPFSARGAYSGNLNSASGVNSTVQDKADCFSASGAGKGNYGTRDFEIRGDAAFSGTPTITFNGYDDESGDIYANYTLTWSSSSTRVVVRFAGHAAVGVGQQACIGYGEGLGAGSISGGPYHFKFLTLDGGDLNGERDNQLMSGAIKIPPLCGLTGPTQVCPEFTGPLVFNYDGGVQSAGASLTFELVVNTANATFANNGSLLSTTTGTADANGHASVNVYPQTGGFIPNSDFQVKVTATNAGGSCNEVATVTHVVKTEATASANPTVLNVNLANQSTQLDASVKQDGDAADPSGFSFAWTVDVSGVGHFSPSANVRNPQFIIDDPAKALQVGELTFTVTATLNSRPNTCTTCCTATSQVSISFTGGASCPGDITGTTPVCPGGSGTYSSPSLVAANTLGQFPGAGLTYTWTISPSDAGTISGNNVNVTGITVNNITKNFTVVLTISFASGLPSVTGTACQFNVTLNPTPVGSADPQTICSGGTTSVALHSTVANTTFTWTAAIFTAPTGGAIVGLTTFCSSSCGTSIGQQLSNTGTSAGVIRFTVTPTANGCVGAPFNVDVTVNPVPSCGITGDNPVCEMSTHTYTSTVLPAGGTVTHSWSITGNGTINGSTTGSTVSVTSGSINSGGSFTLRDDVTRNTCPTFCTLQVTVQDCGSGCTIGFWKTHPEVWNGACTLPPKTKEKTDIQGLQFYTCTKFLDVFPGVTVTGIGSTSTMLDVLALSGGNCQTVARQGVGSLLNAIAFSDYPYPAGTSNYTQLKTLISQVLLTGSYTTNGVTYDCASLAIALNNSNNHEVFDVNGVSICSGLPGTQTQLPVITFRLPATDAQQLAPENFSVKTYPNPFNSSINFNISSAAKGTARLEIFDMLGRRIALVYEGNLDAGAPKTITYKVTGKQRVPMIYKLTVGGKSVYGKLLPGKE